MADDIQSGTIIGAASGAVAGLILWLIGRLNDYEIEWREKRRVYKWLDQATAPPEAKKWRTTRAIASYNNLPEDRVRYVCSRHPQIVLSTKEKEVWGIKGRARDDDDVGVI
jgi:hypothetical protein